MTTTPTAIDGKFDRLFDAHDTDNDGHIDWSDYDRLVKAYLDAAKVDSADRRAHALKATFQMWWMELLRHGRGQGGRLSREEYIQALRMVIMDMSRFNMLDGVPHAIFDVLDADGDNQISRDEFQTLLGALKVPGPEARERFDVMDIDGDGVLSRQEVLRAWREFFYSPDERGAGGVLLGTV
ncbi:Calerythrin [Nocardiopsis dassonvillei]|uniref:EF-hand domain-containing protein n=1 Tax=Nocardiopsis dassonvillei TaxID=2014 RepID=UPI003F5780C1